VRSVKEECLFRVIVFRERALRHALTEYVVYIHQERPHQGTGHVMLMPAASHSQRHDRPIQYRERLGGLP
jgi:putative transposase